MTFTEGTRGTSNPPKKGIPAGYMDTPRKNGVSSHQHHFSFFAFQENPKGFRPEGTPSEQSREKHLWCISGGINTYFLAFSYSVITNPLIKLDSGLTSSAISIHFLASSSLPF